MITMTDFSSWNTVDNVNYGKLQGECQELEERGQYDQYHNRLRQLEQRQAASRHPGL